METNPIIKKTERKRNPYTRRVRKAESEAVIIKKI
jgi:hypothetical protein